MLVEVQLKLERVDRVDPTEQAQAQRVAGLKVTLANRDVLRDPDFDRGPFILIIANEADKYDALLAVLTKPGEQHLDHLLV